MRVDLLARLTEMERWRWVQVPPVRFRSGRGTSFELLTQIRNFPVLPLRVDLAVNLLTTAISVRTVVRLQKILR